MRGVKPQPVEKIVCPKCKELQIKIYPYSSYHVAMGESKAQLCAKCVGSLKT